MLDQLAESLGQDRKVEFRKFGVFRVQRSKGRIGRNPNRPEYDIPILPRAIVKFRAGKELKARVMKLAKTIPRGTASASSSHGEGS
jgi:DNA-binding protein HU-beta/integration host factor subunit alpha